jgi:hypothetical protein
VYGISCRQQHSVARYFLWAWHTKESYSTLMDTFCAQFVERVCLYECSLSVNDVVCLTLRIISFCSTISLSKLWADTFVQLVDIGEVDTSLLRFVKRDHFVKQYRGRVQLDYSIVHSSLSLFDLYHLIYYVRMNLIMSVIDTRLPQCSFRANRIPECFLRWRNYFFDGGCLSHLKCRENSRQFVVRKNDTWQEYWWGSGNC